ncbi:MAG: hypothetical protein ABEJ42_08085 [Halobacteriaceae archaeon]
MGERDGRDDGPHGGEGHGEGDGEADEGRQFGLSFSLPPIRLPPVLSSDFEWALPPLIPPRYRPGRRGRVAGALVLDATDAALALAGPPGATPARTVVGTALAIVAFGHAGVAYGWEVAVWALAGLIGDGGPGLAAAVTAAPTFCALVVGRALLARAATGSVLSGRG